MVQGISPNTAGYPVNTPAPVQVQTGVNNPPARLSPQEVDQFVSVLETQHKKGVRRKNIMGGSVAAASLLALLGGSFLKNKWGRLISIAPIALTTLGFGAMTLAKGNKTPPFRDMIYDMEKNFPPQA